MTMIDSARGRTASAGWARGAALLVVPMIVLVGRREAQAQTDSASDNSQSYLVGGRAAGMGGAFTAIADDESGMFYNPAGLAKAARSSLSLSVSLYGYVRGEVKDGIDVGSDYGYSGMNIVPSTVGWVKKLSPRATLALGAFAPNSLSYKDQRRTRDGDILVTSSKDETLWVGAGIGFQVSERWSLGLSAFGLYRAASGESTIVSARAPKMQGSDATGQVYTSFIESRITTEDQAAAWTTLLGARYQATDWLAVGAAARLRSFDIWGQSKYLATQADSGGDGVGPEILVIDGSGQSQVVVSGRLSAGVAISQPRSYTVALDYSFQPAVDSPVPDPNSADKWALVPGTPVHNVNLGFEFWPGDTIAIRTGFFTNRSGTPRDVIAGRANHVDQYGGSIGLAFTGDHTETTIGATGSFGAGDGYSLRYQAETDRLIGVVVPARQLRVYAFVGTSYRF